MSGLVVDSFAGGGGASLGIEWALGRSPDIAINHDKEAIALHAANHAGSKHYAEDVWKVDPVEACGDRPVALMWLSPDCKHFSKAKGGKPVSKRVRGLAWVAVRWAAAVRPTVIVLENVEEFQSWGPIVDGRPDPERAGYTFRRFVGKLRRLGYRVEWRELRGCDYGAPTIRKRLFLIARCDGRPIHWPTPTHGKGRAKPWRTAAECIEWSIECPSIFERKRPLADNTLRRIARGIRRFVIENPRPFLVTYYGAKRPGDDRTADLATPLPTQSTENRFGLIAPHLIPTMHAGDDRAHSIEEPMRTITCASRGDHALVASTLIQTGYGEDKKRNGGLGQTPRVPGLDKPLGTIMAGGVKHALVSAFLAKHYGGHESPGSQLDLPISTVTTQDHHHLVASTLVSLRGTAERQLIGRSITDPLPTISGGGIHAAEVRAFLTTYYSTNQNTGSLFDPLPTVSAKDRFGLVTVHGVEYAIADIGMRMLAPRELYRAQGFPDTYRIDIEYKGKPLSKTAQVRMCGNSVCPPLAEAIVRANVGTAAEERVA